LGWLLVVVGGPLSVTGQAPSHSGTMEESFTRGQKWAVVIGVNDYLDPSIDKLRYCVADARLIAQTLAKNCGYDAERILLITDDQEKAHLRPLKINLQKQLPLWLKNARPGDTVLVFFAGHGFLDDRSQGFLAPQDCEKASLGLTALRTDDLRDMLHQCAATRKLLVLDCCHAGGARGAGPSGPSSQELGAAFKGEGLITLASCRKSQTSEEWPSKNQGLFTYFLAQGLAGAADYDHNALIDSQEIYRYTLDQVSITAQREMNTEQTPVEIRGEDVVGVFPLASVPQTPQGLTDRLSTSFLVRRQDEKGPPAAGVEVKVLYRARSSEEPLVLGRDLSNREGIAEIEFEVSRAQKSGGEFLAEITSGDATSLVVLPSFLYNRRWNLYASYPRRITTSVGLKLALIPAGEFLMGRAEPTPSLLRAYNRSWIGRFDEEFPQHRVRISKPFYMGVHEVTVGQFRQFVSETDYQTDAERTGGGQTFINSNGEFDRKEGLNWRDPGMEQTDEHPVVHVSWDDAMAFCRWLSKKEGRTFRLPTEAEWEYACAAGTSTRYWSGDDPESLATAANSRDGTLKEKFPDWDSTIEGRDGYVYSSPVGRFRPNPWGLYDMHGNVWEFCMDWYDPTYYRQFAEKTAVDPTGPTSGERHLARGGCFY
jgi:formylglycine-generating enzyme required for sulfatase activity